MSAKHKSNVFMFSSSSPLRLELTLLTLPLLAIAMMLVLALAQTAKPSDTGKVTLRVTSIIEPPDPELAREAALRQEQIRFALSKVAKVPDSAIAQEPIVGSHAPDTKSTEPDTTRTQPAPSVQRVKLAGKPRDIRPGKLRSAVRTKALRQKTKKTTRQRKPANRGNWITASLKWPVVKAGNTIAPVQRTLVSTVSHAGDVLKNLRQKIL